MKASLNDSWQRLVRGAWPVGLFALLVACDNAGSDASDCAPGDASCQCTRQSDCMPGQDCLNNQCVPQGQTSSAATVTSSTNGATGSSVGGNSSTGAGTNGVSGAGGDAANNTTGDGAATDGSSATTEAAVMLVLDRSTSAAQDFGDDLSRWEAIVQALTEAGGPVERNAPRVALGVLDYTGFLEGTCPVFGSGVQPSPDNYGTVEAYIAELTLPEEDKSETPTREAIEQAVSQLAAQSEPKAIVLVTDGLTDDTCEEFDNPGCVAQAYYAAQQAYAGGVRTYILGVTDLEDDYLQGMANAGTGEPVADFETTGIECGPEGEQPETSEQGGSAPFWQAESAAEISEDLDSIFQAILDD